MRECGEGGFKPEQVCAMPVIDENGKAYEGVVDRFDEETGDVFLRYAKGEKRVLRSDWEQYKKLQSNS